ncbi:uncharacterized protein [Asterias amurensis]|uniref:uncharacterized protein n=1 Tax=Asterias amurensis TaxID=7602 RepID=UPI003AB7BA5C
MEGDGAPSSSLAMEDQLNNNFAAVPDCLLPDLDPASLYSLEDDQAVPVFDQAVSSGIDTLLNGTSWPPSQRDDDGYSRSFEQFVNTSRTQGSALSHGDVPTSSSYPLTSNGSSSSSQGADGQAPVPTSTSPTSDDVTSLHCSICFRTFKHKLSLTNHQRSHTTRQPYSCTICGETFKYKTNFKRHKRGHVREMRICKYCGLNMDSDYDLVQHEKEHRRQQKPLK